MPSDNENIKPQKPDQEENKPTYEQLEQENLQLIEDLNDIAWRKDESERKLNKQINELRKEIKKLQEHKPIPTGGMEEIYTYGEAPFNKLTELLEKNLPKDRIKEELGDLYGKFHQ